MINLKNQATTDTVLPSFDDDANATETLREKLIDAQTPGYQVEFDPEEAEQAGAFIEDALTEEDAIESAVDSANEE
ncbi:hypothetical protein [Nitrosomonas halophila]|uniref:Conjugal transfer protein TraD n=1 Tax=Nitrosomonas halophila TaxID=44576 RepID=A0A1H3MXK8_9PROT|nr:hypothetical protein [Nitrosomonas halophila]SDY81326.1 hypothetical protein SAMN05421881_10662 [Nitrosomonas halophila]